MPARIGVLAPKHDPMADQLAARLAGQALRLDLELGGAGLGVGSTAITWGEERLDQLRSVWVMGYAHQNPVLPTAQADREWSLWQVDHLLAQQRFSTQYTLLAELERRGVAVYNGARAHLTCFARHVPLERLRAGGYSVPPLLCSNEVEQVAAFAARHARVVWRPITGRAAWQLFTPRQQADLVTSVQPAILLAAVEPGWVVRSYLLGGREVLRLRQQVPSATPQAEGLERVWHQAGPGGGELAEAVAGLGLGWASVTGVERADGVCIYEVEPDPRLDWLPEPHQNYLLTVVAGFLANGALPEEPPATLSVPTERPSLYLRRMLRVLFEFEASKYPRADES